MSNQLSVITAVCPEYQRLLEESQRALEIWNERRVQNSRFGVIGREAGDALLRLQAKFARAYAILQNHAHNCSHCQLAPRRERRDSQNSSDTLSDTTLYL